MFHDAPPTPSLLSFRNSRFSHLFKPSKVNVGVLPRVDTLRHLETLTSVFIRASLPLKELFKFYSICSTTFFSHALRTLRAKMNTQKGAEFKMGVAILVRIFNK